MLRNSSIFLIVGLLVFISDLYSMENNMNIFNKDQQNITAINGTETIMKCNILVNLNLSQYMNISWIKSPRQILTRGFYRVTENKRFDPQSPAILNTQSFNIKISPVLEEDQGEYRCNFIYGRKIFAKSVTLFVQVPPKITKHPPALIKVDEGKGFKLTCAALGKPPPKVHWYFVTYSISDVKLILIKDEFRKYDTDIHISQGNLKIERSNREMRGTYRCMAESELGSIHWDTRVLILYPPEIQMANEIITQNINQNTIIVCVISAYPMGQINWFFGNISLKTNFCTMFPDKSTKYCINDHVPVSDSNDNKVISRLNLYSLTKNDFGIYTCKSQSILGSAQGSTQLKIASMLSPDEDTPPFDYKVFPKLKTEKSKNITPNSWSNTAFQEANSKKLLGHSKPMGQQQSLHSTKPTFHCLFLKANFCLVLIFYYI